MIEKKNKCNDVIKKNILTRALGWPGIAGWVQGWVSWVESGLSRKPN